MAPDEIERALYTDFLTGLGNARALLDFTIPAPAYFVALDLVGLKQTNDAHGWDYGDARLLTFACGLAEAAATAERIAPDGGRLVRLFRPHGDEFVIAGPPYPVGLTLALFISRGGCGESAFRFGAAETLTAAVELLNGQRRQGGKQ